ncbi:MAG: 6-phosphofructokinase [Syntrophomonadaceae bacterium]|nr:6-phosphofructokinase [Syntrophomonadaceae bacterium]
MKRIAILTSGGDAPGMNAAIRAVVRTGTFHGLTMFGVNRGFHGLMYHDFIKLTVNSVGDIIHRGGTILRTSRSKEFRNAHMRMRAKEALDYFGIDVLFVIGGNGSLRGGYELAATGVNIIGIPASIDNDIPGTDKAIGFDTAVNTVLEAINRIRDTATSHERIFIIEVMGRESGQIALAAGLAGGAESILVPELPFDIDDVVKRINSGIARGKLHSIILVAEGCCSAIQLGKKIEKMSRQETRVTVLGHTQRGGTPTAADRILASRMGSYAVEMFLAGHTNQMIGAAGPELVMVDLQDVVDGSCEFDREIYQLARILSI